MRLSLRIIIRSPESSSGSCAGYLTLEEWDTFESLLSKPDADYQIAFRRLDVEGKGEFSQLLRVIQGEKVRLAFDTKATGFIEVANFMRIVQKTDILDNLNTFISVGTASKIPYANVRAFQNVVREMDTIDTVVRSATAKSKDGKITLPLEMLPGGTAGACQVVFTNPLKIVKTSLRVQRELTRNVVDTPRRSSLWIVKNLGVVGLDKGLPSILAQQRSLPAYDEDQP
ncbi:Similar to Mitochondrial aspartate-glutamate transporter AGC1; acc. no. Q75AH6 [Pyronema omphalodes CBS 100304]|uniref:Similar to Mitochondrial aspartate-glutamate transporter AGC1 acc. no. Q75AH6 n=1 Tax=Pyronema omphalodes (strain CBS 100304) TaxID=1076935 RepID=U4L9N0_PYROM|nr:Similar to Mitochondrial aspartate-glutamate transporter AGC1; acc. no. Q75AH6 [Pyronema omphalodes CBS 100304]